MSEFLLIVLGGELLGVAVISVGILNVLTEILSALKEISRKITKMNNIKEEE